MYCLTCIARVGGLIYWLNPPYARGHPIHGTLCVHPNTGKTVKTKLLRTGACGNITCFLYTDQKLLPLCRTAPTCCQWPPPPLPRFCVRFLPRAKLLLATCYCCLLLLLVTIKRCDSTVFFLVFLFWTKSLWEPCFPQISGFNLWDFLLIGEGVSSRQLSYSLLC